MIVVNVNKYDRKPAFRSKIRVKRFQVRLPFEFLTLTFCLNHFDLSIFQFSKHVCSTFGRFGNVFIFNTNGFTIKNSLFSSLFKTCQNDMLDFFRSEFRSAFAVFKLHRQTSKLSICHFSPLKIQRKIVVLFWSFSRFFSAFFFSFFFYMKVVCFDFWLIPIYWLGSVQQSTAETRDKFERVFSATS